MNSDSYKEYKLLKSNEGLNSANNDLLNQKRDYENRVKTLKEQNKRLIQDLTNQKQNCGKK